MKAPIFASILCLFSVTVLAAPPPSPSTKICKTLIKTDEKDIGIVSGFAKCYTPPTPAYPFYIGVLESDYSRILAFDVPECKSKPVIDQKSPVLVEGHPKIASFMVLC